MTIEIKGYECDSDGDALAWVNASGRGRAITIGGKALVVEEAEAHRLESAGIKFAYLIDHEMPDGSWRIVTIPVND